MIDMPVPNDATQIILEVYLQVLEVNIALVLHSMSDLFSLGSWST